jgi:hypothetical protein
VHITRKCWSPEFCGSYVPLNLEISQHLLLKQLVSAISLKLLKRIFRRSTFPGNMHNYIWCPYYLPSFMKFCSVVSEELRWQTVWRTDGQDKNNMSPHKSKNTICSCAYYQEILISWILWELCPFELRNFPKFTIEAACQRNSSETTEQNFGITPTKFRGSKFPGNMHNYIWCPYYLPSFMKFRSLVSEELCWQAASVVNF